MYTQWISGPAHLCMTHGPIVISSRPCSTPWSHLRPLWSVHCNQLKTCTTGMDIVGNYVLLSVSTRDESVTTGHYEMVNHLFNLQQ